MTQDYNQAFAYVSALAGDPATVVIDWRCIHDVRKDIPALPLRGTLLEHWQTLVNFNENGYGVFATINAMDGEGRELINIDYNRTQCVDLDDLPTAQQSYEKAVNFTIAPSFAVQSSPGKFHVYWPITPYNDNDRYKLLQRKIRQFFNGDKNVVDATRVLRVPGFYHLKNPEQPHLVTCWSLGGYGQRYAVEAIEAALQHVNVIDGGSGERKPLGDPDKAAPSLAWLARGLELLDPNDLDRDEWVKAASAIKQSGWSHTTPENLYDIFSKWSARYIANDIGENDKLWKSINDTELGWSSFTRMVPSLQALLMFSGIKRDAPASVADTTLQPVPEPTPLDFSGEFLTHYEQQEYFKGCYSIEKEGRILTPSGRFMNASQFNMRYGGKQFIITSDGKKTDEAWKAATRSTLWNVPRVDHVRFVPTEPYGTIIYDQLGRPGVNTFIPVKIKTMSGDVGPFLDHMEKMIPNENDRNVMYMYMAHNVKFPGAKIRWAPMIQSTEGVGKGFLQSVMENIIGEMYCYSPKAQELVKSGSTFNGWMRGKLMIVVNEIKVDEKRELVEILKPMLTDKRIEVQSKGIDQDMEDNPANWLFFSNFKDAIPVTINGRRYAVIFSAIQSMDDLVAAGMNDAYFNRMFTWINGDGSAIIADWLMRHSVTLETMPQKAPYTSSMAEAIEISRSPIERTILDAIEDQLPGFRGGWISVPAVLKRIKVTQAVKHAVSPTVVNAVLEKMGYVDNGRAPIAIMQEGIDGQPTKPQIYYKGGKADTTTYSTLQGWN